MLEGKVICILLDSDPMICKIGNSRIGLCHRLARNILVEPVHDQLSAA
jgi:Fe2+ transport system protein FeoA